MMQVHRSCFGVLSHIINPLLTKPARSITHTYYSTLPSVHWCYFISKPADADAAVAGVGAEAGTGEEEEGD